LNLGVLHVSMKVTAPFRANYFPRTLAPFEHYI